MHILVIDRWRNVRIAPKRAPTKFFFGCLRELLVGHEGARAEGQLEFECDGEFFAGIQKQVAEKNPQNVLGEDTVGRPTFEGVPILVLKPAEA